MGTEGERGGWGREEGNTGDNGKSAGMVLTC